MADGLDREYIADFSDKDRLRVRFKTKPEQKPTYAVMLECQFIELKDQWIQVMRLDDWDGCPHIDRAYPDGTVSKEWLPDTGNNKINTSRAVAWAKSNWEKERERYESQLKQSGQ
ncbi:MAG: hypothetical protein HC924_14245 [Synechococcaceae cyanobacterium SM2_3_2]|nr:hypothetical protein [Synechococcaceae cyanobacterium SM2_3_2]